MNDSKKIVPIHLEDVEMFHTLSEIEMKSQGVTTVVKIHPVSTRNVKLACQSIYEWNYFTV